ncbi:cupin domain-containing protein [Elioraea sp.]|uniref:cupin domain-containing protein n=1 Tax=Elioraea sp. TaxID=2185103 RepID=UPI0025BB431F|nr:hypothetical protein [Elioraea sp.]
MTAKTSAATPDPGESRAAPTRRRAIGIAAGAAAVGFAQAFSPVPTLAQDAPALVIRPLAEKRIERLPVGPLVWRIETFASLSEARAAEGPTGLALAAVDRFWLCTLGPPGGGSQGATKIAEVGPVPEFAAPRYLLRINQATGQPGSVTPVHTHPGSEAFYVIAGETSQRTPHGVMRVRQGEVIAGHGADVPMQVSSTGATDLLSLVMFVVDATKPFSQPATMP